MPAGVIRAQRWGAWQKSWDPICFSILNLIWNIKLLLFGATTHTTSPMPIVIYCQHTAFCLYHPVTGPQAGTTQQPFKGGWPPNRGLGRKSTCAYTPAPQGINHPFGKTTKRQGSVCSDYNFSKMKKALKIIYTSPHHTWSWQNSPMEYRIRVSYQAGNLICDITA